jgi:hypothetical protein
VYPNWPHHDVVSLQGLLGVEPVGLLCDRSGKSRCTDLENYNRRRPTPIFDFKGPSCHFAFGLLLPAPNPCVAHSGKKIAPACLITIDVQLRRNRDPRQGTHPRDHDQAMERPSWTFQVLGTISKSSPRALCARNSKLPRT